MSYFSIQADRCINVKEKILKPFLCEDCNKLPIQCYKSLKKEIGYYCGSCIKMKNVSEYVEDSINFSCLLISCAYKKNGCDKEFLYSKINELAEHEEICLKKEVNGKFFFRNCSNNELKIKKKNKSENTKKTNKMELIKTSYEEKLTKMIDKFEEEKRRLLMKVEYLTNKNLSLELKLQKQSSLKISNEIRIEFFKSYKNLNSTQPITISLISSKKENLVRSTVSSVEIVNQNEKENYKQKHLDEDNPFSAKNVNLPSSLNNQLNFFNNPFVKDNESKLLSLNNNNLSSSISNSLFSTNLSNDKCENRHISFTVINGKASNSLKSEVQSQEGVNISKTQVISIAPEKLNEIKSVLDKMDSRYFNNFNLLESLNTNNLTRLGTDIKNTMSACGKDYIPTKSNGTMDMRFSVNKDLVALFKSYDLLSKNY
jgi:hypothetical protein